MSGEGIIERDLEPRSRRRWIRERTGDECDGAYQYNELSSGGSSSSSINSDRDSENGNAPKSRDFMPHILFFVGSVLYVIQAVWDLKEIDDTDDFNTDESTNDNGTDDYYDDDDQGDAFLNSYNIVVILAASTYVLSAGFEVYGISVLWTTAVREELVNELVPIVLFGIAALLELSGVLVQDDESPQAEYTANTAAVHVYLLESIMSLWGDTFSLSTITAGLLSAGKVLFLMGCIIDVVLSYLSTPDTPASALHVMGCWSVVSAVLWLVDAILFLLADFRKLRYADERTLDSRHLPLQLSLPRND